MPASPGSRILIDDRVDNTVDYRVDNTVDYRVLLYKIDAYICLND